MACALWATACASASSGTEPQDAPPHQIDSGHVIDGPPAVTCQSAATCVTSMDLGSVSGDKGAATQMASGFQSAWFKVRVTEDDNGVAGVKLSVTAQLTSPGSADYDVFTYINTGSDTIECTTASGTPNKNGKVTSTRLEWGEGTIANGNDDSRSVEIEIRPASQDCSAAATWQLLITGDT